MEKKYTIHPVDAYIHKGDGDKSVGIALCRQGSATKPHQRKEAEMLVRLLNWYDSIDKELLEKQFNVLCELNEQFDKDSINGETCEGVINMLGDLQGINEDLQELENVSHKDNIEKILISKWTSIGMDIPENFEQIVQFVFEDVMETSDYPNYSDGDVMIGFRRWIENDNAQIM
jgi:hypothetical protein